MAPNRFLNNLKECIIDFLDWYKYATLKQQYLTMMTSGGILGFICGRIQMKRRIAAGEFNKEYETVAYTVENEAEFEHHWNKLSRLAQKQPGYLYTKFYKASYPEKSPIHYFKIRMWRNEQDMENFKNSESYKVLRNKLDSTAKEVQFGKSTIIIDDSVRRQIPFDSILG